MIQILKTAALLAVVLAVIGGFTVYGSGRTAEPVFAEGHDSGGSYDPGPVETYDDTSTDTYVDTSTDTYDDTSTDTYVDTSTDTFVCVDCDYVDPSTTTYVDSSTDTFVCVDCGYVDTSTAFYSTAPSGEFVYEPTGGESFDGGVFHDGGEFSAVAPDLGFQGTFSFDSRGDFVFEGVSTFDGGFPAGDPGFVGTGFDAAGAPGFGGTEYFPDGEFHDFFDPGDFAPDLFVDTFRPDEFAGDFGDFFLGEDFQPGTFDDLFNPGEFRPDEFGSFFNLEEFKPGDFGEFATVGDDYVDFGGHFDQFWGERPEDAQQATAFFAAMTPGEGFAPPEDLVGELHNLDYQGFQDLDSNFVVDLFNDGLSGQEFDLRGDQWAGAFSRFEVEDIKSLDHDFVAGAVQDFAPQDFLGIPDDQAFAMFEATFLGGPVGEPLPGASFIGGPEGGAPPPFFVPGFFEQQLDQFEGQIGGFLGAMGPEHFGEIEDGQLVDMFSRVDFGAPDFDPTVLGGKDLGGIFGALEHETLAAMGQDQIIGAIGTMNANDFKDWDPAAALGVFENIGFDESKDLDQLGGLVGAMGPNEYGNIEGGTLVGLFDTFAFGGPDFDLAASGMDQDDIAGMIAAMGGEHMPDLGNEGITDALQHLDGKAMGAWDGGTAYDVFSTVGFDQALGLDQLEGIVGNFGADHIQQLGDNLDGLLENLDFQNNGEVLQDFSFGTLGVLNPEDFQGLGVQQLLDLANTTGGDEIVGLDADRLQSIIGNVQNDSFNEFDPSVVGGIFAGLDHVQIGEFDHETMEAALEAAGANLLGGLGDFNAFTAGNTTFDELADLAGFGDSLEQDGSLVLQDGVFNFFGGDLFGSN